MIDERGNAAPWSRAVIMPRISVSFCDPLQENSASCVVKGKKRAILAQLFYGRMSWDDARVCRYVGIRE